MVALEVILLTDSTDCSLRSVERQYIELVLAATGGNRRQAANILGIDPKTLYNKLRQPAPRAPSKPIGLNALIKQRIRAKPISDPLDKTDIRHLIHGRVMGGARR